MKESRRKARMERHHKRNKTRSATLNMVSLMDIFTILVFFLLVNASSEEVISSPKEISLPESVAEQSIKENIMILVSNDSIMIQGKVVANPKRVMANRNLIIPELLAELDKQINAGRNRRLTDEQVKNRGITIMGDKEIPYKLLKKIMVTCAQTEFTNISLAVEQKSAEQG